MSVVKNCDWCNTSFNKKNDKHRFCSTPCRKKWHRENKGMPLIPSFIKESNKRVSKGGGDIFGGISSVKQISSIQSPKIAKLQADINWLESQKVSPGPNIPKMVSMPGLFLISRVFTKNIVVNTIASAAPLLFSKNEQTTILQNANIQKRIDELEIEIKIERKKEQFAKIENLDFSINQPPQIISNSNFKVINAKEVDNLKNEKYLLDGKWRYFLNYMPHSFNCIIYGLPKAGKTHLSIQFAQYLQNKYGSVLYISGEEGVEEPFNDKLKKYNSNFKVAYDVKGSFGIMKVVERTTPKFVFIDSLNRLGLKVDDIITFKETFKNVVFVYIMQSTKDGKFKGSNSIEHEVTSTINVVNGVAHQKGRTIPEPTELTIFN